MIKCFYSQGQIKNINTTWHPAKNFVTWTNLKSYSLLVFHEQMGSKSKAKVISDYSFLLPYLPLVLHPPVVIFLWAPAHHPSSAFHSPTTLVHITTTLITSNWFHPKVPAHSSSSVTLLTDSPFCNADLPQAFSSSKCLRFLIPHPKVSKSQNQILQNITISGLWLIFECKISHTHDYVQPRTQGKFEKDFSHQWNK